MPENPFPEFSKLQSGELRGKYSRAWVEETLVSIESTGNPYSAPRTKKYLGLSIAGKRFFGLIIFFLAVLVFIIGRVAYLQLWNGTHYRILAESNRLRVKPVPAERGIFYDVKGKQLVQNIPSFNLTITPNDVPRNPEQREKVLQYIASAANVPTSTISDLLKRYQAYGFQSLTIKENFNYDAALRTYIQSAAYPGVSIESGTKRLYTYNSSTPSLSHIFGYVGKLTPSELEAHKADSYTPTDNIGKTGLEKQYESLLRGRYGTRRTEVNATGRELSDVTLEPPTPGNNVHLTIDFEAQKYLETLVRSTAEKLHQQRIAAVALDPRDGAILALVSWPAYDNNDFSGSVSSTRYSAYLADADKPLFNRVIAGTYPSGSIVKLVVAAAALNEGIISPQTTINSTGGIEVGPWFFRDWKVGGHGITNVYKAIASSVNSFFYYIGGGYRSFPGLGVQRLVDYFHRFGLGEKTGIDLPGEGAGLVPTREWKQRTKNEQWYIGDTYNISIGQGDLLVTPIQAAVWTAAIANGGTVVTPHLVHSVEDPDTKSVRTITPKPVRTNIISSYADTVTRAAARECVLTGSCGLLRTLPFTSGGKTGTAQWNSGKETRAWFTAFAPYDKPKIVITVLVEEGGEGGVVSIPIARDFLSWWGKRYLTE